MTDGRLGSRLSGYAGIAAIVACHVASIPGARAEVPAQETVRMEPFFVRDNEIAWRYARVPGYEILSHYPDPKTADFLRGLDDAQNLLDFVIPPRFQAKFDVPHILILCDEDMMSPAARDIMGASSKADLWTSPEAESPGAHRSFPNIEGVDKDRIASLVTNRGDSLGKRITLFSIGYVRFLLDRRTPQLPPWLVTGVMSLYSDLYAANKTTSIKNADAVERRRRERENSERIALDESDVVTRDYTPSDTYERHTHLVYRIPPFAWITSGETGRTANTADELYGHYGANGTLLLGELFSREPLEARAWEAWKARATLFVRWALDREYPPRNFSPRPPKARSRRGSWWTGPTARGVKPSGNLQTGPAPSPSPRLYSRNVSA
jgi:hypothetical protein